MAELQLWTQAKALLLAVDPEPEELDSADQNDDDKGVLSEDESEQPPGSPFRGGEVLVL